VWLPSALESIGQQSLRPAAISIQYSGFKDCASVLADPTVDYGMPLIQNCSTAKLSCGGGRNAAVARCGPHIDFYKYFDADDEMMPYQLERMVKLMHDHNATIGYHGYYPKDSGSVVRDDAELRLRIRNDGGRWRKFSPFHELQTQHGQPMVRASYWKPLDDHNTFQEDIRMAREAWIDPKQRFVHTTEKLTRYMRRPPKSQKNRRFRLYGRRLTMAIHRPKHKRVINTMHTDKHRSQRESTCTVVMLGFPTQCGQDCQRNNRHTQDYNVAKMVDQLQRFWFGPFKTQYPLTIFHEDYNETQMDAVRKWTRSPIVFSKIDLGPYALPVWLRLKFEKIQAAVRGAHRGGNLWLPSMRGTYHGFGYRMMCRFFAGLIMWHEQLAKFTYYMRVDAGDSRLTKPFTSDPFVTMIRNKYLYGYQRIETAARNARFDHVISRWKKSGLGHTKKLLEPFVDTYGRYNGRYYYNKFEIVHLPTFRMPLYRHLFNSTDMSGAFMLGDTPKSNLGDADFRSVSVAFMMSERDVHRFTHLNYAHPVSWDAPYP
tara:strand:+ start:2372 stop:3997 length:1626 start_codon:yes stop_codon:yes gene_type:complete